MRVYLKHHNDPDGKFQPTQGVCASRESKSKPGVTYRGCGGSIFWYVSYPGHKGVPFDGPPVVVGVPVSLGNGGIVAEVQTENVHFATCTARSQAPRPTTDFDAARRVASRTVIPFPPRPTGQGEVS